jgi:NADPH-dependent glutamate synthase beta subunit-like oxidoreductase/flavodoxin/NAD-dependent dihydropyrimidine dehydrogenase PreA subunit
MKSIVIYFSQTGSTKKIAEAIYSGIKSATGQCEITTLREINVGRLVEFDLIGLGCPTWELRMPANFRAFEESMPALEGKHCFLFTTHGMDRGMVFRDMGEVLLQKGLIVIGYRSWYGAGQMPTIPKPYFTDGHPDSFDLKEAADFGKEMVERSLRVSQGEKGLIPDILSMKERLFPPEPAVELKFNKEKCRYPICRLCVDNCPVEDCINLSQHPVVFAKKEKCLNCYFCWKICPNGAIEADWGPLAKAFREIELPGALKLLERAEARGYFRRLVDKVDVDTPWYTFCDRPALRLEAAPCILACPIHMDIPGYLTLAAEGRLKEAYQLMRKTNPLPAVCSRVCYHPCEDACRRHYLDQPVAIAPLRRFVTDRADIEEPEVPQVSQKGRRVAIIGSGPCGLAAAHDLALLGYEIAIFEALPELGGMMRVGIPEYRVSREVVQKDIEEILKMGIEVKLNTRLGYDLTLNELRQQGYEAILLATGAHLPRPLNIEGMNFTQVFQGVYLLRDRALGKIPHNLFHNKRVVVIGGGNVAIDAARTALRLGAKELQLACLEKREEMPAHPGEIQYAVEEGAIINCSWGPRRILGKNHRITSIELIRCTSVFDEEGRFNPSYDESARMSLKADAVIVAIGQVPDISFLSQGDGIQFTRGGTIKVDSFTLETDGKGIFAGGDVVTGAASVIEAIAAGKRAARSIDNYLKGIPLAVGQTEERRAQYKFTDEEIETLKKQVPVQNRVPGIALAPEERIKNFAEVELGLPPAQGQQEARRCLKCEWKP